MKRMLLSFAMGLVVLTSVAQGTWKKVQMEADELRGVEAGKGYVRFVAPRYNKSDFDIKVMPYKE